jgi:hypothetical protein
MKRKRVCITAVFLGLAHVAFAQNSHLFQGEISDSQCAHNAPVLARSHEEMLKSKSLKGTSYTCAAYCVRHGSYLVLASGKDVYAVDRSDLVLSFKGQKVRLTGTLDPKTNRIHVQKIVLDENK